MSFPNPRIIPSSIHNRFNYSRPNLQLMAFKHSLLLRQHGRQHRMSKMFHDCNMQAIHTLPNHISTSTPRRVSFITTVLVILVQSTPSDAMLPHPPLDNRLDPQTMWKSCPLSYARDHDKNALVYDICSPRKTWRKKNAKSHAAVRHHAGSCSWRESKNWINVPRPKHHREYVASTHHF